MGDVLVFAEHVKGKLPKTTLAAKIASGRSPCARIRTVASRISAGSSESS